MKTVGIIGGLGPETTAEFYLKIISDFGIQDKTERPPILIWNIPLPLKIEEELLMRNIGEKKYLPFLIKAAKILEEAEADFLVMPCNTMHIFIMEIRNAVNIPVLSIIEETVEAIKKLKLSEVGILATTATINKKLFQNELKASGIKEVIPNKIQQQKLDRAILNLVTNKRSPQDKIEIDKIIEEMVKKGIKEIILGCTDLQLIIKDRSDLRILDTMKILVGATVNKINK